MSSASSLVKRLQGTDTGQCLRCRAYTGFILNRSVPLALNDPGAQSGGGDDIAPGSSCETPQAGIGTAAPAYHYATQLHIHTCIYIYI